MIVIVHRFIEIPIHILNVSDRHLGFWYEFMSYKLGGNDVGIPPSHNVIERRLAQLGRWRVGLGWWRCRLLKRRRPSARLVWRRFLPGTHGYRPGSFGGM